MGWGCQMQMKHQRCLRSRRDSVVAGECMLFLKTPEWHFIVRLALYYRLSKGGFNMKILIEVFHRHATVR